MMNSLFPATHTAFVGHRLLAAGPLPDVALAVKAAAPRSADAILVFEDATGRQIDLDLSGTDADVVRRHPAVEPEERPPLDLAPAPAAARARGRPKLGVVAREVTLLPRHWEWLAAQPGGASVALRKLVEKARRENESADRRRRRQEAAYRYMSSMAGNLPGFEEAVRALYADDPQAFAEHVQSWPEDVRAYATRLAWRDAQAREDLA
ncbi:DUF2239 family protein [Achromobacter sp. DMS1]|uniref:DUF2239 family protein n=1 Tax=Achromobacter sp. DMS1 TaxID=1688405 RepID=UPI000A991077